MTLRPLFIQAAWTTFKCLRPNASSENAKEHLIEDSHGVLTTPLLGHLLSRGTFIICLVIFWLITTGNSLP